MINPSNGSNRRTVRSYPTYVLFLHTITRPTPLGQQGSQQEGDICALLEEGEFLRKGAPGLREASQFLLVPVRGYEQAWMDRLAQPETNELEDDYSGEFPITEIRRFNIPFARLIQRGIPLDVNRVRDQNDPYQPLVPIDEDGPQGTVRYLRLPIRPLPLPGLVFDNRAGRFI
jgi:hypothetical protein